MKFSVVLTVQQGLIPYIPLVIAVAAITVLRIRIAVLVPFAVLMPVRQSAHGAQLDAYQDRTELASLHPLLHLCELLHIDDQLTRLHAL